MRLENNFNNLNRDDFISTFGVIFEKTQWIAESLFDLKPFKDKDHLINQMIKIYETANKDKILNILKSDSPYIFPPHIFIIILLFFKSNNLFFDICFKKFCKFTIVLVVGPNDLLTLNKLSNQSK